MRTTLGLGLRILTGAVVCAALSFTSCKDTDDQPKQPTELTNQIEYNGESQLIDIRSAVYEVEDADLYTLYFSPTAGITDLAGMKAANDYLKIVARDPQGSFSTDTDEFKLSYKDFTLDKKSVSETKKCRLSADLFENNTKMNLFIDVQTNAGKTLRARYVDKFSEVVPVAIANQFDLNKTITAIGSVVE